MAAKAQKYGFLVEHFDTQAQLVRKYYLYFYPKENSVELYDIKNRRTFLKKVRYPSIQMKDLFIGSQVTVYARHLKLVDYANDRTRNALEKQQGRAFLLVKPDAYEHTGKIIDQLLVADFTIANIKMARLSSANAAVLLGDDKDSPKVAHVVTGNVVGIEVVGAMKDWANFVGSYEDRKTQPKSLSAQFATDQVQDAVYSPPGDKTESAIDFFFSSKLPTSATMKNCTCCVIRPHAVSAGQAGKIIDAILSEGFEISAIQLFKLSSQVATEFLEVYKTVVPEYHNFVQELSSGRCIALEIIGADDEDVVQVFREFAGPPDPEIGKKIRPKSLRARFGSDRVHNAVHATDLPDDGTLECEYFFSILQ